MPDQPQMVVYQLKIALRGLSPLIWRRLLVHAETSLAALHHILQLARGWTDSHLHRFLIYGQEYGIAYDGGMSFDDDPTQMRLANFRFHLRERFGYAYDFGDNWQHDLRVEQIVRADTRRRSPVCIGGKRAAPPEECGGVEGYLAQWRRWKYDFLCGRLHNRSRDAACDFFTDAADENIDEPGYDPDQFDRRQVNKEWRQWAARGGRP